MKKAGSIISLSIIGLFIFSIFISMVSAQTVAQDIISGIKDFAQSTFGGIGTGTGFPQFLLFLLVALIIYAVAEELPFVGQKGWLAGLVAIVVSILATFFLKSEEIYTILISYGALGITLTAILPFIVLAVISKRSHDKGHPFLSKILWITFLVVTLFRWLLSNVSEIKTFGIFVYPIITIITLGMLFWEDKLLLMWFKYKVGGEFGSTMEKRKFADYTARIARLTEDIKALPAGESKEEKKREYNEVIKEINKMLPIGTSKLPLWPYA